MYSELIYKIFLAYASDKYYINNLQIESGHCYAKVHVLKIISID